MTSTIILILAFYILYLILVKIVPADMTVLFRLNLGTLRDDICDDIWAGRVKPSPFLAKVLQDIDRAIEIAPWLRISSFFLAMIGSLGALLVGSKQQTGGTVKGEPQLDVFRSFEKVDREKIAEYKKRFNACFVTHILFGSPSGWAAVPFAVIAMACLFVYSVISKTMIKTVRLIMGDSKPMPFIPKENDGGHHKGSTRVFRWPIKSQMEIRTAEYILTAVVVGFAPNHPANDRHLNICYEATVR